MTDVFPLEMKIEPKTEADQRALPAALDTLVQEDPTFRYDIDPESREIIVAGQGELHLDLKIDDIKERFGIGIEVGALQVVYLEVLMRPAEASYSYRPRELHGGGVKVDLAARPLERGGGDVFVNAGDGLAEADVAAVEASVDWLRDSGTLIGVPLVDCEVTLKRLERIGDRVMTSAVMIAARHAMRQACHDNVGLIEPVMALEVTMPYDLVGFIIGNLNRRRGLIRDQRTDGESCVVDALVPLANLFGYINDLRGMTGGRGACMMTFSHYQLVSRNVSGGPDDTFPSAVAKRA